ncbi:MAG: ABC transporter ATP-binding protein [Gaiellaceae bacterium]
MAEIVLENVTKRFAGGVTAVDDVTLAIPDGEFMVLVGPSGCGKSTLLRMIAGLEEMTAGRISIGGRVVNDLPPKSRDIAMVFQNYALYPNMSVEQNLGFGLKLRRMPKVDIARRVTEAARVLGLDGLLRRKPGALSGGQRQRVAMGRAMVREPQAFLMDEPLSNLDAKLRVQMRAELARLRDRLKTTTVYVTHDQVEAMTLGDRVAVLRDGVLQQVDRPQNLFNRPANLFVAAFIGSPSMNLVEAKVEEGAVTFGEHRLPLPVGLSLDGYEGRSVILGIRPSDFEDADFSRRSDLPTIEVTADVVEELGTEANVLFGVAAPPVDSDAVRAAADVDTPDVEVLLTGDARSTFTASVDPATSARPGRRIRLTVNTASFHYFDPSTGEAVAVDRPARAPAQRLAH